MAGEMVWMDLEMTGLDLEKESIIEIATIITDGELNIIAQGPNLAIKVDDELLDNMDEWNTTHHHQHPCLNLSFLLEQKIYLYLNS